MDNGGEAAMHRAMGGGLAAGLLRTSWRCNGGCGLGCRHRPSVSTGGIRGLVVYCVVDVGANSAPDLFVWLGIGLSEVKSRNGPAGPLFLTVGQHYRRRPPRLGCSANLCTALRIAKRTRLALGTAGRFALETIFFRKLPETAEGKSDFPEFSWTFARKQIPENSKMGASILH